MVNTFAALLALFVVVIIIVGVLAEGDGAYRGLSFLFGFSWSNVGHSEVSRSSGGQGI